MIDFMVKLQDFRTPFLSKLAEYITITAEETAVILIMCIVFWSISREHGYKLILSIVLASASSAALKLIFKVERPWIRDSRIESIRQETAGGYSMPSGHTQVGASMWFSLHRSFRKPILSLISYAMMILIAMSRVFLGVHTPQDVLAGLAFSIVGVLIAHYAVDKALEESSIYPFLAFTVLSVAGLFFFKDGGYYKMTGLLMALPLAFFLENKYIKFNAKTSFFKQILKLLIGFTVVLLFKEGLKFILPDTLLFDLVRYFFVGVAAVYGAPLIFVSLGLAEKQA